MKARLPRIPTTLSLCTAAAILFPSVPADTEVFRGVAQQSDGTSQGRIRGRCHEEWKGPTNASCVSGDFHPHPGHRDGKYQWTCRSRPHTVQGRQEEDPCSAPMQNANYGTNEAAFQDRFRRCAKKLGELNKTQQEYAKYVGGSGKCSYQLLCENLAHQISVQRGTSEQGKLNNLFRKRCKNFSKCHAESHRKARNHITALDRYSTECGFLVPARPPNGFTYY